MVSADINIRSMFFHYSVSLKSHESAEICFDGNTELFDKILHSVKKYQHH